MASNNRNRKKALAQRKEVERAANFGPKMTQRRLIVGQKQMPEQLQAISKVCLAEQVRGRAYLHRRPYEARILYARYRVVQAVSIVDFSGFHFTLSIS